MTLARTIIGTRVDAVTYDDACARIERWAIAAESRVVCVTNVHGVMEGHDDPSFRAVINAADIVTPDGVPLVWALRWMGVGEAERVYGPDLTERICALAERRSIPVAFYGGEPAVLERLIEVIRRRYPALRVAYAEAPPFRPPTAEEDAFAVQRITESGARILFVGLGCPKQERWMSEHRGRVPAVMVGVGAAFDFLAGAKPQAPRWMMRAGLEWAFRLATEPRRLWRRYLRHNPRFVVLLARQLARSRSDRKVRQGTL